MKQYPKHYRLATTHVNNQGGLPLPLEGQTAGALAQGGLVVGTLLHTQVVTDSVPLPPPQSDATSTVSGGAQCEGADDSNPLLSANASVEHSLDKPQPPKPPDWLCALDLVQNKTFSIDDVPVESPHVQGTVTHTNRIVRRAGRTIYIQNYDRMVGVFNVKPKRATFRKTATPVRREDSVKRSARRVKDLALCNHPTRPTPYGMPVFLTTTYADESRGQPSNRAQQIADNHAFIRKLRAKYGSGLLFLGVFELQDGHRLKDKTQKPRMTIQSHWLVFNMPYNDASDITALWGLGRTHVHRLEWSHKSAREVSARVANYITKVARYMAKDFGKTAHAGQKTYFLSEGLAQPEIFLRWEDVDELMTELFWESFECSNRSELLFNPHFGAWCVYEEWNPPNTS